MIRTEDGKIFLTDVREQCLKCQLLILSNMVKGKCLLCDNDGYMRIYRQGLEIHTSYLCLDHVGLVELGGLMEKK